MKKTIAALLLLALAASADPIPQQEVIEAALYGKIDTIEKGSRINR